MSGLKTDKNVLSKQIADIEKEIAAAIRKIKVGQCTSFSKQSSIKSDESHVTTWIFLHVHNSWLNVVGQRAIIIFPDHDYET